MFGLGLPELIVILVILLLVFGATRLPKLSRSAGESIKEFKRGMKDLDPNKDSDSSTSNKTDNKK